MQNYIVTGGVGLLGTHIVYELVSLKLTSNKVGRVVLFIREKNGITAEKRLRSVFGKTLRPDYLAGYSMETLMAQCEVVACDLRNLCHVEAYGLPDDIIVIHAGSSVNLGTNKSAQQETVDNNYKSTIKLFNLLKTKTKTFVFVSTAYSSGHRQGKIGDDFFSRKEYDFRNPYEAFKNKLEIELRYLCRNENIAFKVVRPSVICGRLIDTPKFVINKFLVFYLLGYFFSELVRKNKATQPIRIYLPEYATVNIVPVDYVAKVIVSACTNKKVEQLNIVSRNQTSFEYMMRSMLKRVGFCNYTFVYKKPCDLNLNEKNYYRWIDSQLHAYIHTPEHHFDTTELEKLHPQGEEMDVQRHFDLLFNYALAKGFKNE